MSNNFKNFETLDEIMNGGMVFKPLEPGKHTCKFLDLKLVKIPETADKPAAAYFKLYLKIGSRTVSTNLNKTGVEIVANDLYKQFKLDEDISWSNLIASARSKESIDVWVVRKTVLDKTTREPKTYTNYRFVEPVNK